MADGGLVEDHSGIRSEHLAGAAGALEAHAKVLGGYYLLSHHP